MNVNATDNAAEQAHQHALKLIYRHTHSDFKGVIDGVEMVLVCRAGVSTLVPLDSLTEPEVADRLPAAIKKEAKRVGKSSC